MKRFWFAPCVVPVSVSVLIMAGMAAPSAQAALKVDTSPGNGAPPPKLGGFTMGSSPQDQRANNAPVMDAPATSASSFSFDQPVTLLTVHQNWCSSNWAGGTYRGRIYNVLQRTVKVTLPSPMSAVYFYGQPDQLSDFAPALNLTARAQDGSAVTVASGPTPSQAHHCDQGRPPSGQFFGFWGTNGDKIQSITVSFDSPTADVTDFAIGNFALAAPAGVSRMQVAPHRFALTGRRVGTRCVQLKPANRHQRHCARPVKLRVSYTLGASASVRFTIARQLSSRVVNGSCVAVTRKNRRNRKCTRLIPLRGSLARKGKAGKNAFKFNGRIGGRRLAPDSYRLTAMSTSHGATGNATSTSFAIAP
jgi:hypothetical protein